MLLRRATWERVRYSLPATPPPPPPPPLFQGIGDPLDLEQELEDLPTELAQEPHWAPSIPIPESIEHPFSTGALENQAVVPGPIPADPGPETRVVLKHQRLTLLLVGVSVVLLATAAGIFAGSWLSQRERPPLAPAAHAGPAEALAAAEPPLSAAPAPPPVMVEPAPPAAPAPTKAPEPHKPAEARKPPPPPTASWRNDIERGWEMVEKQPTEAAIAFRAALAQQPSNSDANYGLGYALLKLNEPDRARPYLCKGRVGDESNRRDIDGLLRTRGLTCP